MNPHFRIYVEVWKRRQSTVAMKWGVIGSEEAEQERPEFKGKNITSPIDGSNILYFPRSEQRKRNFIVNVSTYQWCLCLINAKHTHSLSVGINHGLVDWGYQYCRRNILCQILFKTSQIKDFIYYCCRFFFCIIKNMCVYKLIKWRGIKIKSENIIVWNLYGMDLIFDIKISNRIMIA